jgi:pilus assembly protein CpaE
MSNFSTSIGFEPASYGDPNGSAPGVALALISSDLRQRAELRAAIGGRMCAEFDSVEQLEDALGPNEPVVAVLGPSMADPIGLTSIERLTRLRPEVAAILVVEHLTTDLLQRALRAGVRDVLSVPLDPTDVGQAIARVESSLTMAPARSSAPSPGGGSGREGGRVVTVFSTKGGAGKSVVAVNLAVALARRTSEPVVLVDADLQFGDVSVMLKLAPQHTIIDAVNAGDLDAGVISNVLARHDQSGLLVLPAPLEPAFADQIGSAQMTRIIDVLKQQAAYVIVDTPAYFNDVVLGLLESSDDVLLVAGMDIPNIKNVKIGLQTLRMLNIPLSKLKLILNRANSKVKLDVGEVERTLGVKADCLIPSDVLVPQAVNKGAAVVLDAPRSSVARSLEELADLLSPVAAPSSAPKLFRR